MKGQHARILLVLISSTCISLASASAHPCEGTHWSEYVASPNACYKLYSCSAGTGTEYSCAAGHVFDPARKNCVPGNQETCEIFVPPTTTQRSTVGTTVAFVNPCGTGRLRTTVAHPTNCYQYVHCIPMSRAYTNVPYVGTCEDGHIFNTATIRETTCVPGDQYTCEIFGETTTEVESTTTEATAPSNPCEGKYFGQVEHRYLCHKYYLCVLTVASERTCPDGNIFDSNESECVLGDQETCEIFVETTEAPTTESTTEATTTTKAPSLNEHCKGRYLELVEYPEVCWLMILCYDEMYFVQQCPEFEIFDVKIQSCRYGDQLTCTFDSQE